MANRKQSLDYAETAVLPEHFRPDRVAALDDAAAETQGRYHEYLRMLDQVPVLLDVVREPPRVPVKDFRLGERADARRAPRDDVAALREQHVLEVARQYVEYAEACAEPIPAPRKPARKKGGPKKKRAKRAKRSARSST